MRIRRRNTQQSVFLTVQSISIVFLSVLCFLVAGWAVITIVRAIVG
ncbi:MAG: hypothetical protein IKD70_09635 [Eggerthellaceae bacterium]|nr:hypothetical protein [Eggerthellaceae bacterium]